MKVDPINLLAGLCEKPGMYVHSVRFDTVWSFIEGYCAAREDQPLRGFHEWLCLSRADRTNAPWFVLVRERVYGGTTPFSWIPTDQEHQPLIAETRRLLLEFKAERDSNGLDRILSDYEQWRSRAQGGNPHNR